MQCNSDEVSGGNLEHPSCGGIFQDNISNFLDGFSTYIGVGSALAAEILTVMFALGHAERNGWNNFELECDP